MKDVSQVTRPAEPPHPRTDKDPRIDASGREKRMPSEAPSALKLMAPRQGQRERQFAAALLALCVGIMFVAWYSDVTGVSGIWTDVPGPGASPNIAEISCQRADNVNLPYCVERRAKSVSSWRSVVYHERGRDNPFGLWGDSDSDDTGRRKRSALKTSR